MKRNWTRRVVCVATTVAFCSQAGVASAYNFRTHSRLVEVAAELMANTYCNPPSAADGGIGSGPTSCPAIPMPSGVSPTAWNAFVSNAKASATKLAMLQSGLPDLQGGQHCNYGSINTNLTTTSINQLPVLALKDGQPLGGTPIPPTAPGFGENDTGCGGAPLASIANVTPVCNNASIDQNNLLGRTLGWLAGAADDNQEDTQLWIRPGGNPGGSAIIGSLDGLVKSAEDAAAPFVAAGAVIVMAFECFLSIFGDGSCNTSTVSNLMNDLNNDTNAVLNTIQTAVAGWGFNLNRSMDYVGVWHFEDAAQFPWKTDHYNPQNPNQIRGILYTEAGPSGIPGFIDYAIVLGGDLGLSVDPSGDSAGIGKYSSYDQVQRCGPLQPGQLACPAWMYTGMGQVEFSTLDNLALYGWNNFVNNPTTAQFLEYPLHALGDAAEPHHAAGTTAYGHRPYEDAVDDLLDTELLAPPASCALVPSYDPGFRPPGAAATDCGPNNCSPSDAFAQSTRIMQQAFTFWSKYQGQFSPGVAPIQAMVQDLAVSTYNTAVAQGQAVGTDGAAVYNDAQSTGYWFNNFSSQQDSIGYYEDNGFEETMEPLLEQSSAMIIAFLMGAAETAMPPNNDGGIVLAAEPDGGFVDATSVLTVSLVEPAAGSDAAEADAGEDASSCGQPCTPDGGGCAGGTCISGCCELMPH